jgi:hypothetical protein
VKKTNVQLDRRWAVECCLLAYIERDIFDNVELENEMFLHDFQNILQKGLVIL